MSRKYITTKEKHRKYELDKNYFENIDNHNKAYFLGFICADGCLTNKSLILTQKASDSDILYKLNEEIKSERPLRMRYDKREDYNREPTVVMSLSSEKLYNDLNKLGITENKTHTLQFPDIDEKFHNSFILGVFDGDGCLYIAKNENNKPVFSIVGNEPFILKIQEILNKNLETKGYIKRRKIGALDIITLSYSAKPNCIKILSWLYKDSNIRLDRKYLKFQEVIKDYLKGERKWTKQYSKVMEALQPMALK